MEWPYNISAQDILSRVMSPLGASQGYRQMPQMTPAHFGASHQGLSDALLAALQRQASVPGLLAAQAHAYQPLPQGNPAGVPMAFWRLPMEAPPPPPAAAPQGLLGGQNPWGYGSYNSGVTDGSANGASGSGAGDATGSAAASGVGGGGSAAAGVGGDDGGTY